MRSPGTMTSGETPLSATSGAAMPAAVATATDAEPRAMRRMTAMSQARMIGLMLQPEVISLM